jgi:hypothetical protein
MEEKTRPMKVMAVCLKSYQDEDSVARFEDGEITADEIKIYHKGEKGLVFARYCSKEHWKIIK